MQYIEQFVHTNDLSETQRDFLEKFEGGQGICIYAKLTDGSYAKVEGVGCPMNRRGEFKEAPDGLFLSGAAVFILVDEGICVVPDERAGGRWKAAAQGWSNDEGPYKNALRELHEEIVAFRLRDRVELLPPGAEPHQEVKCLGIKTKESVVHGELQFLRVNENIPERVIEFVYVWDLRGVGEPIGFGYDDDFFRGGYMGANVHVLDEIGNLKGQFSGQQGFVATPTIGMHPVVKQSWEQLSGRFMALVG